MWHLRVAFNPYHRCHEVRIFDFNIRPSISVFIELSPSELAHLVRRLLCPRTFIHLDIFISFFIGHLTIAAVNVRLYVLRRAQAAWHLRVAVFIGAIAETVRVSNAVIVVKLLGATFPGDLALAALRRTSCSLFADIWAIICEYLGHR